MIRAGISARIEEFDDDARGQLWEALRAFIANHREYADADWALGEEELKDYDPLLVRLSPNAASERLRYLFDEHLPGLTSSGLEDLAAFEAELEKRRAAALDEIEAEVGPEAVLVTLSLDFEDGLSSADVERTVSDIERTLKGRHEQIVRLFVEAQSLERRGSG